MKIQREIKTSHQQNLVHTLFEEQETILYKRAGTFARSET